MGRGGSLVPYGAADASARSHHRCIGPRATWHGSSTGSRWSKGTEAPSCTSILRCCGLRSCAWRCLGVGMEGWRAGGFRFNPDMGSSLRQRGDRKEDHVHLRLEPRGGVTISRHVNGLTGVAARKLRNSLRDEHHEPSCSRITEWLPTLPSAPRSRPRKPCGRGQRSNIRCNDRRSTPPRTTVVAHRTDPRDGVSCDQRQVAEGAHHARQDRGRRRCTENHVRRGALPRRGLNRRSAGAPPRSIAPPRRSSACRPESWILARRSTACERVPFALCSMQRRFGYVLVMAGPMQLSVMVERSDRDRFVAAGRGTAMRPAERSLGLATLPPPPPRFGYGRTGVVPSNGKSSIASPPSPSSHAASARNTRNPRQERRYATHTAWHVRLGRRTGVPTGNHPVRQAARSHLRRTIPDHGTHGETKATILASHGDTISTTVGAFMVKTSPMGIPNGHCLMETLPPSPEGRDRSSPHPPCEGSQNAVAVQRSAGPWRQGQSNGDTQRNHPPHSCTGTYADHERWHTMVERRHACSDVPSPEPCQSCRFQGSRRSAVGLPYAPPDRPVPPPPRPSAPPGPDRGRRHERQRPARPSPTLGGNPLETTRRRTLDRVPETPTIQSHRTHPGARNDRTRRTNQPHLKHVRPHRPSVLQRPPTQRPCSAETRESHRAVPTPHHPPHHQHAHPLQLHWHTRHRHVRVRPSRSTPPRSTRRPNRHHLPRTRGEGPHDARRPRPALDVHTPRHQPRHASAHRARRPAASPSRLPNAPASLSADPARARRPGDHRRTRVRRHVHASGRTLHEPSRPPSMVECGSANPQDAIAQADAIVHAPGAEAIVDGLHGDARAFQSRHAPDPRRAESVVPPFIERLRSQRQNPRTRQEDE